MEWEINEELMFTGIITDIGRIGEVVTSGDTRIKIDTNYNSNSIKVGSSIACSGPCLTVVDCGEGWFAVDVSAETMTKTTIKDWFVGCFVNLERALCLGDEFGGHLVTGHIDGIAALSERKMEGDSVRLQFKTSNKLQRFVAPKGSVALDGISLTVNEVEGSEFGVNIIPHTQHATTLGSLDVGRSVNVEIDLVARYVDRLLKFGDD